MDTDTDIGGAIEGLLLGYAAFTVIFPHIAPGFEVVATAISYGFLGAIGLYIFVKLSDILIMCVKLIMDRIIIRYVGLKEWMHARKSRSESEPESSLPDTLE